MAENVADQLLEYPAEIVSLLHLQTDRGGYKRALTIRYQLSVGPRHTLAINPKVETIAKLLKS